MGQLPATFERLRRAGRKALIPFVMAGDPDLATTRQLLPALADAGADVIEVGVPFSDPLADGPVIQAASARALAGGTTPARILDMIAAASRRLQAPVVVLTYWNPVLQFGGGRAGSLGPGPFVRAAAHAGVAGLIVPDLPLEEGWALRRATRAVGMSAVFLAAPTSPAARLRAIARASEGFIYYVSVAGTTGVRRRLDPALLAGVRTLKRMTTKPVCVGFGISTPSQAAAVAAVADGVIVGSALIAALGNRRGRAAAHRAQAWVRRMRAAV